MEEKTLNQDLENKEVETGNTPEAPKKSKGKAFLQLVIFILLSMAGFIVQMIIEQVGGRVSAIKNMQINGTTDFELFGIPNTYGAFIVSMVAIFICKIINFVLHRKVLFKPRHNLTFGIVMYVIFSVALWFGSAVVKKPVQDALMGWSFWTEHITKDPEGWALTLAVMVYSTADLIIMFFAEKFLIMNDKLFKKKNQEEIVAPVAENVAPAEEQAVAADSAVVQDVAPVAEEAKAEEVVAQEQVVEEVKEQAPVEEIPAVEEAVVEEVVVEEVKTEEPAPVAEEVQETPVEEEVTTQEAVAEEVVEEVVATEEVVADAVVEEAPAKKPATKKTATSTAKKTTASTAKKTSTAKKPATSTAKKTTTASKSTTAKKTTTTKK